jgi:type IV fimbrial biogenesis protein FimT
MMRKSASGFTLIELMVVLTVLAILASIGVPSFRELIASQRVKDAGSTLQSALLLTRSEALKRNTTIALVPATAGQWNAGWRVTNPGDGTVLFSYEAFGAVTISGPASIVFQPSGRASSGAAFKIAEPDATKIVRCISITLSGVPSSTATGC